tara:strand:+ start:12618 stop:13775 length:1158 start_codon:yes stop_codon:yes gene_type:complete
MEDNIIREDVDEIISFLSQKKIPRLTNGPKVVEFEKTWSRWLGTDKSVFVNSGHSANQLTMLSIKHLYGAGEVILSPLNWISDVSSVIQNGFTPVFVDINYHNLALNEELLVDKINDKTKAILLTHILGLNGLTDNIINICKEKNILLIEDVCESHGATHNGQLLGTFGDVSNFSFFFAHHMTTIEGGMVSTNNEELYEHCKMFRSHGMLRECTNKSIIDKYHSKYPTVNKDFFFVNPAYNVRSTEINAVLGLNQIKRLNNNITKRTNNFNYFNERLNPKKFYTKFNTEGNSNYAFIIILNPLSLDIKDRDRVEKILIDNEIEFRRGLSGGGNQLRQPYIQDNYNYNLKEFPVVEHIHNYSWYVGNYPSLESGKIDKLLDLLNNV